MIWIPAILAVVALVISLVNLATWPRGRAAAADFSRWSVLVPARNEAANIEACVRSVFAAMPGLGELIACDDHSTDETPAILSRLQHEFPSLRVIQGRTLPAGWVGKPHACWQLGEAASGEVLLFVDADVRLHEGGACRIADLLTRLGAGVLTAVPRQQTGGAFERLVLPMLHLTYLSWLPNALVHQVADPRVLAANGQVLAFTRHAYEATGGFSAVRAEVVDDMAITRIAKQRGLRVVFADGHHIATCRMYRSATEVWKGFSKNLYEGIGGNPFALAAVLGLYLATFVAPWLLLAASPWLGAAALASGAIGASANLAQRLQLWLRHGYGPSGLLTHLAGVLAFVAIALNSAVTTMRGRVEWSGRTYAARHRRAGGST
jgi:chlorobactene glucosyltransferase